MRCKNKKYIDQAAKLYQDGLYDYIELYSVPGSFSEYRLLWDSLKVPYIIHAPHLANGVINFALKEYYKENKRVFKEVQQYADLLNAKYIVVHPGIGGDLKEIFFQIKQIADPRLIIENMPYYSYFDNWICQGKLPAEMLFLIEQLRYPMCLDIGHAIYSANALKQNIFIVLEAYLKLLPSLYHLSDGDFLGMYDGHRNLGKGSFELKKIISLIPSNSQISIETEKNFPDKLDDFVQDIKYVHSLSQTI